jgi:uncharacterized membrane protein
MNASQTISSPLTSQLQAPHAHRKRSISKTISWRLLGSLDTFVVAYVITGEVKTGAFIVSAEMVTKMILYYLHERGWAHIRWGLK